MNSQLSSCRRTQVLPRSQVRAPRNVRVVRVASQEDQKDIIASTSGPTCATCGVELSKAPAGCDKEGREIGGMGALPGFGWWPIKAYRPCPMLNAAQIEYVRKGQITNDILFGGGSLGSTGIESFEEMKKQADRGIKVD